LLSIRPRFAEAILRGEKRYEFRRFSFSREVTVVMVYATVPVRRVIAEFDVVRVITASPEALWRRTRKFAGLRKREFLHYFDGKASAHAIEIGDVRVYRDPFCPVETLGLRAPQSFVYVS
jgi:predicted transcriptional regulator